MLFRASARLLYSLPQRAHNIFAYENFLTPHYTIHPQPLHACTGLDKPSRQCKCAWWNYSKVEHLGMEWNAMERNGTIRRSGTEWLHSPVLSTSILHQALAFGISHSTISNIHSNHNYLLMYYVLIHCFTRIYMYLSTHMPTVPIYWVHASTYKCFITISTSH